VPFPRKLLNENEELVLDLRPHWVYLALPTAALVGAVALALVLPFVLLKDSTSHKVALVAALILLVAALVYFAVKYMSWVTTMFVLTSDRILTRRGILSKSGTEIPLERINTVFFHQSVFERMVGAGDLTLESAGEKGSESFTDIRKPAIVQREIYVQMEHNENRKFDRARGPEAAGLSTAEQLEKLHGLLQQGALTQAQFDAEKAKLLGS